MRERRERKKREKKREKCQMRWRAQINNNRTWGNRRSIWQVDLLLNLIKQLCKGYAAICFYKKSGKCVLVRGTLTYYEEFFNRPFEWESLNGTIPYWDVENLRWGTFQVENLVDWKPIF